VTEGVQRLRDGAAVAVEGGAAPADGAGLARAEPRVSGG
jgi:hypothetical protein